MIIHSPTHSELLHMLSFDSQNQALWTEFTHRFHEHICFVVTRELKQQAGTVKPELKGRLVEEVYLKLAANSAQAIKAYRGREEDSIYRYLEIIAIRTVIHNTGIRH